MSISVLAERYGVKGQTLRKQYKEKISDYRNWDQLEHAHDYLLYPENIGEKLSLDETCLSNGDVYTILTNKAAKGRKGALVAIVRGVATDAVSGILRRLPHRKRLSVKTVTTDLSSAMMLTVRKVFPAAKLINDRFHVQQLMSEAVDQLRIRYRWKVLDAENQAIREHRQKKKETKSKAERERIGKWEPERMENGETLPQIVSRSKHIILKHWSKLTIPKNYSSALNLHDTQLAIKTVKDFFQGMLAQRLSLTRVSAPLFVDPTTGLNDNLNGYERPVTFGILEQGDKEAEVVHSLAKWKRYALKKYGFSLGEGIYTDMNAIRRDEETDNIHSIFVDQWDWEKIIRKEDRNLDFLKETVKTVYKCLRKTEQYMAIQYDYIDLILPKDITFITTSELEEMFPDNTPKEREYYFAKAKGAICVMQIGDKLANGEPHDGRAPDYDDWALNADIIVYYPVLDIALELSSMGIRVDEKALKEQLDKAGCPERAKLPFQKAILNKELPYTIGGGIGQSRICMFFLRKAHIGEVQSSLWPDETIKECEEHGIQLL